MARTYIMALDQGTTSSRAILFDHGGAIRGVAQHSFPQIYPQPGWVEHDPNDILSSQLGVMTEVMVSAGVDPADIEAIGITNQRETTIVWNRRTGLPVANAIVWQCRRTAPLIEELCSDPDVRARITAKTGLVPDAYFSASKIKWILDRTPGAREAAEAGDLAFGTVDSWLIWNLTGGAVHATDRTNASRTMLYDIHEGRWDESLLELFGIPASMLPDVRPSAGDFGRTAFGSIPSGIPIRGVAGDQQAALFGQCCFTPGSAKNTYGTGCFLLMNTGSDAVFSPHGLVTTIAASAPGVHGIEYALEGSVFVAGALVQWMRDELGIIATASESEDLARTVESSDGVYVVPAFTGLGAPYWDSDARGAILGLTRGTSRGHIARAGLESLAFQVADVASTMAADAGIPIAELHVDGGASVNNLMLQFQADILDATLLRPAVTESTAWGAAMLAGLSTGFWESTDKLALLCSSGDRFVSKMGERERAARLAGWHEAVGRVMTR